MLELQTLSKISLFKGLNEAQLTSINHILHENPVAQGCFIVKEETYGDEMYILVAGTVRVTKKLIKGVDDTEAKEKVLATLDSGILPTFGENGLLGHFQRTANVVAHTDCLTYTLNKTDFDRYLATDHLAAYHIMRNIACILSERLENTDNNLVKLATALFIAVQQQ